MENISGSVGSVVDHVLHIEGKRSFSHLRCVVLSFLLKCVGGGEVN